MDDLSLEQKIDKLLELVPIIEALGSVVIRRKTVTERADLNKNTLSNHETFQEVGKVKTYIEIGEIPVVKNRKRNKKAAR